MGIFSVYSSTLKVPSEDSKTATVVIVFCFSFRRGKWVRGCVPTGISCRGNQGGTRRSEGHCAWGMISTNRNVEMFLGPDGSDSFEQQTSRQRGTTTDVGSRESGASTTLCTSFPSSPFHNKLSFHVVVVVVVTRSSLQPANRSS
jgi:hypothetical protein